MKPDPLEKLSDVVEVVVDEKLEEANQHTGRVLSIGDIAFKSFRMLDNTGREVNGKPWVNVGDRISYSKFAGKAIFDPTDADKTLYRIINDEDVIAVITETPEDE